MAKYTPEFLAWVKGEALLIKADGCSKVPDFYKNGCLIHDLAYFYAKSPFVAYSMFLEGSEDPWEDSITITQAEADTYLKDYIQAKSWFKRFSPMAWWRYRILRKLGGKAWNSHKSTHLNGN